MAEQLKDQQICNAFLKMAELKYPELLAHVRENVARAMSGWLLLDGHRADVRWSNQEDMLVGRVKGVGNDLISFRGTTPPEVLDGFNQAVRELTASRQGQLSFLE